MAPQGPDEADDAPIQGIALSGEELFVVLQILKARALPGYDTSWAYAEAEVGAEADITPTAADRLRDATNALIARGYVSLRQAAGGATGAAGAPSLTITLPAPVVALVGACAFSEYTVRVAGVADGVFQVFYLHEFGALGALHSTPTPDIHLFLPIAGRGGVVETITLLTGIGAANGAPAGVATALPGRVSFAAMDAALVAAQRGGVSAALAALFATPLPETTRQALAHAAAQVTRFGQLSIGRRDPTGAERQADSFFLTTATQALFLLPSVEDASVGALYVTTAAQVRDWVIASLG